MAVAVQRRAPAHKRMPGNPCVGVYEVEQVCFANLGINAKVWMPCKCHRQKRLHAFFVDDCFSVCVSSLLPVYPDSNTLVLMHLRPVLSSLDDKY
jgi:hypothetical protein